MILTEDADPAQATLYVTGLMREPMRCPVAAMVAEPKGHGHVTFVRELLSSR